MYTKIKSSIERIKNILHILSKSNYNREMLTGAPRALVKEANIVTFVITIGK